MTTVHDAADLLPGPAELRAHLRALAVLDTAIGDDPAYCTYSFAAWGQASEAALMDNGAGDDFAVLFTPAGVLIRGFDHESPMSPYTNEDEEVWPGVIDDVPTALRPFLNDPAFRAGDFDCPRATFCLWREPADTAWHTGSGIEFPTGTEDPDGSTHLLGLLTDRTPESIQSHFAAYYERPVPLDAVRDTLAGPDHNTHGAGAGRLRGRAGDDDPSRCPQQT
ncbi:hypothetical protein [Streptomyces sp. NPDC048111]|uniref:hypothetical protein n=1 Tax=Streptomyces sp. NPDC048111 TaxID=3365500 RepID=UPI003717E89F